MEEQYLFPFFNDEIKEYIDENYITNSTEDEIYKDIAWDFEDNKPIISNGDFLIAQGLDAVKSWAYRALQTERYKFEILTWNFGLDLEQFIGQVLTDKNKIDLTKEITECLLQNKYIKNVTDFEFSVVKNKVFINFKIITKYGELSEEVKLDGKY